MGVDINSVDTMKASIRKKIKAIHSDKKQGNASTDIYVNPLKECKNTLSGRDCGYIYDDIDENCFDNLNLEIVNSISAIVNDNGESFGEAYFEAETYVEKYICSLVRCIKGESVNFEPRRITTGEPSQDTELLERELVDAIGIFAQKLKGASSVRADEIAMDILYLRNTLLIVVREYLGTFIESPGRDNWNLGTVMLRDQIENLSKAEFKFPSEDQVIDVTGYVAGGNSEKIDVDDEILESTGKILGVLESFVGKSGDDNLKTKFNLQKNELKDSIIDKIIYDDEESVLWDSSKNKEVYEHINNLIVNFLGDKKHIIKWSGLDGPENIIHGLVYDIRL